MHDRDLHANILGISAPLQYSDVVLDIATGTVEAFVEHRGDASCPKCGKPCAGDGAAIIFHLAGLDLVPRPVSALTIS